MTRTLANTIMTLLVVMIPFLPQRSNGKVPAPAPKSSELLLMSLEELMNIQIDFGTLTGIRLNETPFSMTEITTRDIQQTPHRNMFDLMESYVPGAVFTNHWLGPRLGIRGVMGDQNNSYLVLVNGQDCNSRSLNGVSYEVQNRDLNDIEKIEIIRGPGSATYGPGAIGGVINITTKNADSSPGLNTNLSINSYYRYRNLSMSYGYHGKTLKAFLYGSISRSDGEKDSQLYYIDRAHGYGYGFMGWDWGDKNKGTPAPSMYEDFWNKPQYKVNLEINYGDTWTLRSRYSNYSYTGLTQKSAVLNGYDFGGLWGKMFLSSIENRQDLSTHLSLKSSLSFKSQSNRQVTFFRGNREIANHITQRQFSYSENESTANVILHYEGENNNRYALGISYSTQYYGPEWGMNDADFLMSFPSPIQFAVKTEASGFHQAYGSDLTTLIQEDIDASLLSIYGEMNQQLSASNSVLFSFRSDKHEFSDWITSPRVALIHKFDDRNILKMMAQKSVRLPNFQDLYAQNYVGGGASDPEKLKGIELSYNRTQNEHIHASSTLFWNVVEQIAWYPSAGNSGQNQLVGEFETAGIDLEFKYKDEVNHATVSYSYVRQLSWDPVSHEGAWITGLNGERYALPHFAENRLNNFPKQTLKILYGRQLRSNLSLHLDARMMCDYQQIDMLESFNTAHQLSGDPVTIDAWNTIVKDLQDHGYTKPSFTCNLSINWEPDLKHKPLRVSLYISNLLSHNHIRYVYQYWEPYNNRQYSRQSGFVEEPRTFGVEVNWNY